MARDQELPPIRRGIRQRSGASGREFERNSGFWAVNSAGSREGDRGILIEKGRWEEILVGNLEGGFSGELEG